MSVIPLTNTGPNRTVVHNQEDFSVNGDALLLGTPDLEQFVEDDDSNVSYDLRVGAQCRDHREDIVEQIPPDGALIMLPGKALIIQTEEFIHLPRNMYATIAPKVTLLENGLSTTFSKVDPGYNGHLLITLFNLGKRTVTIDRGDRFCAMTVFEVRPGARLYQKGAKQITSQITKQPQPPLSFREKLDLHHVSATYALIVVTSGLFVVEAITLFFFIWDHFHR